MKYRKLHVGLRCDMFINLVSLLEWVQFQSSLSSLRTMQTYNCSCTVYEKIPPNFNLCSTCLNKQCPVMPIQTSSGSRATWDSWDFEVTNDITFKVSGFEVLSWECIMSLFSRALILHSSWNVPFVLLKWAASLIKSPFLVQSWVSPSATPYNLSIHSYWHFERYGFWSRNFLSQDFDFCRTS